MKDMWWGHNAIVSQICLWISGGAAGIWLCCVCVWTGSGSSAVDHCLIQSQRADHRKPIPRKVSDWPSETWIRLFRDPTAANSTGRLIRGAHCAYLWTTVMMTERLRSISHLSKHPLKDNYRIPLSIYYVPPRFNVISDSPHMLAAWLQIFWLRFSQTPQARSVQFSCRENNRMFLIQLVKRKSLSVEEREIRMQRKGNGLRLLSVLEETSNMIMWWNSK